MTLSNPSINKNIQICVSCKQWVSWHLLPCTSFTLETSQPHKTSLKGCLFLLLLFCFIFKSFKKHVIVLKVSLNDPDWPHFSAWPTMATLKLPFLLLYFARLVRTSHIFSQANQCPSEKYFSILIKTTQTFTSARGFYQVWRGKH